MNNKQILITIIGAIVLVAIIGFGLIVFRRDQPVSLADLAKDPTAYDGKTISVAGTIVGADLVTYSQAEISQGDYDAYLLDGDQAILVIVYKTNPVIGRVVTGDTVRISGQFSYYNQSRPDPANVLENGHLTIDGNGSIIVTGKANGVIPDSVVIAKVEQLLAAEASTLTAAVVAASSTASFVDCVAEETKIWNGLCSAAGLPSSCVALNYRAAVGVINNSTSDLFKACYTKFNSWGSAISLAAPLRTLFNASNNTGVSPLSLLQDWKYKAHD